MSYLALSVSFEYLCYGSVAIINIIILSLPSAERVDFTCHVCGSYVVSLPWRVHTCTYILHQHLWYSPVVMWQVVSKKQHHIISGSRFSGTTALQQNVKSLCRLNGRCIDNFP